MTLPRYMFVGLVVVVLFAVLGSSQAAVIPLFIDDVDPAIWNEKIEDNTPSNMNAAVTAPAGFGTGNVLRMMDQATDDKPELQGELPAALTEPFRIDWKSQNQSPVSSSNAIRFRMANSGDSITSESRSAFSVSWQADGEVSAKYSGISDGNATDVDTLYTEALVGPQVVTMVANGNNLGGADYMYDFMGVSRTLNPQKYDLYVNGVLLNDGLHPDFSNGLKFTLEKSAADYDPALGLQRVGIVGNSDSAVDPDVLFDDIIITTGAEMIPEPATFALLAGAFALLAGLRRRR